MLEGTAVGSSPQWGSSCSGYDESWLPFPCRAPSPGRGRILPVPISAAPSGLSGVLRWGLGLGARPRSSALVSEGLGQYKQSKCC